MVFHGVSSVPITAPVTRAPASGPQLSDECVPNAFVTPSDFYLVKSFGEVVGVS